MSRRKQLRVQISTEKSQSVQLPEQGRVDNNRNIRLRRGWTTE